MTNTVEVVLRQGPDGGPRSLGRFTIDQLGPLLSSVTEWGYVGKEDAYGQYAPDTMSTGPAVFEIVVGGA